MFSLRTVLNFDNLAFRFRLAGSTFRACTNLTVSILPLPFGGDRFRRADIWVRACCVTDARHLNTNDESSELARPLGPKNRFRNTAADALR